MIRILFSDWGEATFARLRRPRRTSKARLARATNIYNQREPAPGRLILRARAIRTLLSDLGESYFYATSPNGTHIESEACARGAHAWRPCACKCAFAVRAGAGRRQIANSSRVNDKQHDGWTGEAAGISRLRIRMHRQKNDGWTGWTRRTQQRSVSGYRRTE